MRITEWPKEDRPIEKLIQQGAETLTDAELIAIILKNGIRGKTAVDLAKSLLGAHGNLKKLLREPTHLLLKQPGVGVKKLAALKAAIEIGKRYWQTTLAYGETLNNSQLAQAYLMPRLRDHLNEVFACLFLDTHFRLIKFEQLFFGTVNESNIYIREIIRRCLDYNAAKIILSHNHPSGLPIPSAADKEVTKLIQQALALIDTQVIDHIIIADNTFFSFVNAGLL